MKTTISSITRSARVALLLGLLVAAVLLAAAGPARAAAVFTVNQTADVTDANFADGRCDTEPATSGNQCTLRAAIEQANESAGTDAIRFDVPGGGGAKTIRPTSELPAIFEAVTIDGYTQPGAKKNTKTVGTDAVPLVEISGTSAGTFPLGLRIVASDVIVRGLVINGFGSGGILSGGANTRIEGNFIGTDASGTLQRGNGGAGVTLQGLNAIVGGATPEKRNLISGNVQGVNVFESGSKVRGNLIGTKKDGASPLGNSIGLLVPLSDSTIGGTTASEANTIAFNSSEGVLIQSTGSGNRILGNSIHSNGRLGIDLDGGTENGTGATANDPKDPDAGANALQNKPGISSAITSPGKVAIKGILNSTPNTTFVVRFFSNPPGGEEGKAFVGQRVLKTKANGNAPFETTFAKTVRAGRTVTATATGPEGTSEFSAPRTVVEAQ